MINKPYTLSERSAGGYCLILSSVGKLPETIQKNGCPNYVTIIRESAAQYLLQRIGTASLDVGRHRPDLGGPFY